MTVDLKKNVRVKVVDILQFNCRCTVAHIPQDRLVVATGSVFLIVRLASIGNIWF